MFSFVWMDIHFEGVVQKDDDNGGRLVARLVQTRDDELFTILFFGLAVAFGGIGELLGVSDAIGAFLIGLVLGSTHLRARIEQFTRPLRDVFAAFFFLAFGLALNPSTFGEVVWPVVAAIVVTLVVNTAGGQLIVDLMGGVPYVGASFLGLAIVPDVIASLITVMAGAVVLLGATLVPTDLLFIAYDEMPRSQRLFAVPKSLLENLKKTVESGS